MEDSQKKNCPVCHCIFDAEYDVCPQCGTIVTGQTEEKKPRRHFHWTKKQGRYLRRGVAVFSLLWIFAYILLLRLQVIALPEELRGGESSVYEQSSPDSSQDESGEEVGESGDNSAEGSGESGEKSGESGDNSAEGSGGSGESKGSADESRNDSEDSGEKTGNG